MKVSDNVPEPISWQNAGEITAQLLGRLTALSDEAVEGLDAQNGVYVVTYDGSDLGFGLSGSDITEDKVVYVGVSKFNSSRHFKSGNTGTSTLRRSLGALLANRLELLPVPRSNNTEDADRYSNYAFDAVSEDTLTDWIRTNFKISFLQLDKKAIEPTYLGLIMYNAPIFNFQNNPDNRYGTQIKQARKICEQAAANYDLK